MFKIRERDEVDENDFIDIVSFGSNVYAHLMLKESQRLSVIDMINLKIDREQLHDSIKDYLVENCKYAEEVPEVEIFTELHADFFYELTKQLFVLPQRYATHAPNLQARRIMQTHSTNFQGNLITSNEKDASKHLNPNMKKYFASRSSKDGLNQALAEWLPSFGFHRLMCRAGYVALSTASSVEASFTALRNIGFKHLIEPIIASAAKRALNLHHQALQTIPTDESPTSKVPKNGSTNALTTVTEPLPQVVISVDDILSSSVSSSRDIPSTIVYGYGSSVGTNTPSRAIWGNSLIQVSHHIGSDIEWHEVAMSCLHDMMHSLSIRLFDETLRIAKSDPNQDTNKYMMLNIGFFQNPKATICSDTDTLWSCNVLVTPRNETDEIVSTEDRVVLTDKYVIDAIKAILPNSPELCELGLNFVNSRIPHLHANITRAFDARAKRATEMAANIYAMEEDQTLESKHEDDPMVSATNGGTGFSRQSMMLLLHSHIQASSNGTMYLLTPNTDTDTALNTHKKRSRDIPNAQPLYMTIEAIAVLSSFIEYICTECIDMTYVKIPKPRNSTTQTRRISSRDIMVGIRNDPELSAVFPGIFRDAGVARTTPHEIPNKVVEGNSAALRTWMDANIVGDDNTNIVVDPLTGRMIKTDKNGNPYPMSLLETLIECPLELPHVTLDCNELVKRLTGKNTRRYHAWMMLPNEKKVEFHDILTNSPDEVMMMLRKREIRFEQLSALPIFNRASIQYLCFKAIYENESLVAKEAEDAADYTFTAEAIDYMHTLLEGYLVQIIQKAISKQRDDQLFDEVLITMLSEMKLL